MQRSTRHLLAVHRPCLLQALLSVFAWVLTATLLTTVASAAPKVILISLDGATARLLNQYLASGMLSLDEGLGRLQSRGITAPFGAFAGVGAPGFGLTATDFDRGTSAFIGQDSGDVSALLSVGDNFDGTQNPVVIR